MKRSAIVQSSAIAIALALASAALVHAPNATAYGPGGWDRLGHGATATSPALNGDVLAMTTDYPGVLIVGGKFTGAGGIAGADRIAFWDQAAWHLLGPANSFGGDVYAVATANSKIYAGGAFVNAGGDADADHLAVYDGTTWKPFCTGAAPLGGNVKALEIIGNTLYVGGEFQDGGGNGDADYLMACDLTTGIPTSTTLAATAFTGPVYALTTYGGDLVAGGNFQDLQSDNASDFVAVYSGGVWTNVDSIPLAPFGSVTGIVRALAANATDLYVGSDGLNIDEIPQADHVARWNGSAWSALGANTAGTNGYVPSSASIDALHASGSHVYATGNWFDADGDPKGDYIADFDGSAWHPIGSNGAGNGPLNAKGEALAIFGGVLHVGGNFTSAGGDSLAGFLARYDPQPSNTITIPKVVFNKDKGTATMSVQVPGPGQLVAVGKGFKRVGRVGVERVAKPVSGGTVKLKIKPNNATKEKLRDKGKAKVKVKIKFTPTGGTTSVTTKKIKLKLDD